MNLQAWALLSISPAELVCRVPGPCRWEPGAPPHAAAWPGPLLLMLYCHLQDRDTVLREQGQEPRTWFFNSFFANKLYLWAP